MNYQKNENKNKAASQLQWRQLTAALFFLVVNTIRRYYPGDKMVDLFFIIAYLIFLAITVMNLSATTKLYKACYIAMISDKEDDNEEE